MADLALYRPSDHTWYILQSATGYLAAGAAAIQWGAPGDFPMTADYDGDGRSDLAAWRGSVATWYLLFSSTGYRYDAARGIRWGSPGGTSYTHWDQPTEVFADLRLFGRSERERLVSCFGCGGDVFELELGVPRGVAPGPHSFRAWVTDAQGRSAETTATIGILPP